MSTNIFSEPVLGIDRPYRSLSVEELSALQLLVDDRITEERTRALLNYTTATVKDKLEQILYFITDERAWRKQVEKVAA